MAAWRWTRGTALGGIGASVALMALIGLTRPPATVPATDAAGPFPRLGWTPTPDLTVTLLLWAAMIGGTVGVAAGLLAVRRGWRPRGARIAAAALIAVGILVAAPPMGTTDPLDYAAYGRMAVLGLDPHVLTPAWFRLTGDPVGVLAPREWENLPSVYGPAATAAQWAASMLGGESAAWTVFWLKVWNGVAFLAAALCLHRLAGPRHARVHLLWTLNPLLLWALIGGAHVDVLAAALAVGGLAVLSGSPGALSGGAVLVRENLWRAAAAGALLGTATAVKVPYVLMGAAMFWVLRRSPRSLLVLGGAAAAVLAGAYSMTGMAAVEAVVRRGGIPSWNTPWQLVLSAAEPSPPWLTWASLVLAATVALVLLRASGRGGPAPWPGSTAGAAAAAPALAICLAWVLTTPVYYPWYEALVFPLLAIVPSSRLDWLELGRTLVATLGALPGVVFRLGDSWLRSAVEEGPLAHVVPAALLLLALAVVASALARPRHAEVTPRLEGLAPVHADSRAVSP
jgi:hypothetical protein